MLLVTWQIWLGGNIGDGIDRSDLQQCGMFKELSSN